MGQWALLETSLNTGVGRLLGLKTVETAIATANMQLRSKIHIVKAVVHLKRGTTDWGKDALKDLEAIAGLADKWRNVVAHVPFAPHASGGVQFLSIKAKGKLSFPDIIWGRADFDEVFDEIMRLSHRVEEIIDNVAGKPGALNALLAYSNVTPPQQEQGSPPDPPPQDSPDSHPTTSEITPETPQEPPTR
jgi:hypothetical protein